MAELPPAEPEVEAKTKLDLTAFDLGSSELVGLTRTDVVEYEYDDEERLIRQSQVTTISRALP